MKNMETQPDSPGGTAGAGAGTSAAIGTVEDKLSFLTSGAKLSGVRIQHRTPKGDFQLPVSVTREVPRAPAGPLDGPVVGKHKVSFVDLLTPGAKEPQLVLAKTGLVPAMHAGKPKSNPNPNPNTNANANANSQVNDGMRHNLKQTWSALVLSPALAYRWTLVLGKERTKSKLLRPRQREGLCFGLNLHPYYQAAAWPG